MGFCSKAWAQIMPIRAAIAQHPFLIALADGSLPLAAFQHYIIQDSHYLADYARVLALVAARAPDAAGRLEFSDGAKVAVQVEAALHQSFFAEYGVTSSTPPSPVCTAYSSYLIKLAATRSYEEAIAGLLPCFWIYWDVGQTMMTRTAPSNPFASWIATYRDPAFGAATARVRAIVDAAAIATPAAYPAMLEAFETAARFEWMFWDGAWRRESWPV
jgi:thiaminase (transcriptional activator TenA)